VLLADTFTSYSEPDIGKATVALLERAGWQVRLEGNLCCGRAFISKGLLADAKAQLSALVSRLAPHAAAGTPIVGLEPSCLFTLRDELPSLLRGMNGVQDIAREARLADQLIGDAIEAGDLVVPEIEPHDQEILFHPHCHQKAAMATSESVRILESIPGARVSVLDAGCCGMAGSFGFEREHYDLSMTIGGQRLFPAVASSPRAILAATGVSCRQQILHGTGRTAYHPLQILQHVIEAAGTDANPRTRDRMPATR
jgi:Fe-S oxidoreductase